MMQLHQVTILLMAVLASIGSVGVPSMALVVMSMVFTSVGLGINVKDHERIVFMIFFCSDYDPEITVSTDLLIRLEIA